MLISHSTPCQIHPKGLSGRGVCRSLKRPLDLAQGSEVDLQRQKTTDEMRSSTGKCAQATGDTSLPHAGPPYPAAFHDIPGILWNPWPIGTKERPFQLSF